MLPKEYRINRNRFSLVLKKGRRLKFNGYSIILLDNNLMHPRMSLVVRKGVFKNAAKKTRERRKILGFLEKEIKISPRAKDIIVLLYKPVDNQKDKEELRVNIINQLK
jgi:ribonuclease P protein component